MGLSDIAKAPVSHGVEPHDLETGPSLPVVLTRTPSPLARRPYRASGLVQRRRANIADRGLGRLNWADSDSSPNGTNGWISYIDIHDHNWLKSAVLFWDEIQTIAPTSIRTPYTEADTIVCEQEGYLRPL